MLLWALAGPANMNVAAMEAGADATKRARILQIVPAVHVGTVQAVFLSRPAASIGANTMFFITALAIILAILGFAIKVADGRVPVRLL